MLELHGGKMKITNPTPYLYLGGRIRYLAGRVQGHKIVGENLVKDNLVWLKGDLNELGFRVSLNLFNRKLGDIEKEYKALEKSLELGTGDNSLSTEQVNQLVTLILALEDTIYCEAEEQVIALPTPRRFSLDHLLNVPGDILGRGVFDKLTDIAQYDLEYACKSIAFECATAAAFHILRCVEECVRVLYKAYFPRKDNKKPWGPLLNELVNKPKNPKPDENLLEHLKHLGKRFRNPTDHPEKIYEIEEAEDLVHLSVDVINRCTRDAKVRNLTIKKGSTP